jgi:hypothetical protein
MRTGTDDGPEPDGAEDMGTEGVPAAGLMRGKAGKANSWNRASDDDALVRFCISSQAAAAYGAVKGIISLRVSWKLSG